MRRPGLWWLLPYVLTVSFLPINSHAQSDGGPIPVVSRFAASEGPATAGDGHQLSRITLSFNAPPVGSNWAGIEVYVASAGSPLLVAAGASSPMSFTLESTGTTATLCGVSVTRDGRRSSFDSSPSASVVLDGLPSPPVPVSNLGAQVVGSTVRLYWSENIENDVVRYEIAALPLDASSPDGNDNLPILAALPAIGASATEKAIWDDEAGSANQSRRYFVRTVNSSGQASEWTAISLSSNPAANALAPDGTTDSGVPNWNVYQGLGANVPGTGLVTFFISWGSHWTFDINSPLNNRGITALWIKVYYSGGDGQGSRTFRFADNGAPVLTPDGTRTFTIELPDAVLLGEEHWFENYFGQGLHQGATYGEGHSTGLLLDPSLQVSPQSQIAAPPAQTGDSPADPAPELRSRGRYQE